jgi:hypothetical protein
MESLSVAFVKFFSQTSTLNYRQLLYCSLVQESLTPHLSLLTSHLLSHNHINGVRCQWNKKNHPSRSATGSGCFPPIVINGGTQQFYFVSGNYYNTSTSTSSVIPIVTATSTISTTTPSTSSTSTTSTSNVINASLSGLENAHQETFELLSKKRGKSIRYPLECKRQCLSILNVIQEKLEKNPDLKTCPHDRGISQACAAIK